MKNKVTLNYIYNVAYQILNLITPIITAPYLARTLGATNLGIYNYTYSIIYWFILFGTMGISLYGSKEIAKVSKDRKRLSSVFSEIFTLQVSTVMLSLITFYIIFLTFDFKYKAAFLLQGIMIIPSMLEITWLYTGLENFKKITARGFIVKILLVLGILLIIKNKTDLNIYIIFVSIMNVIGSIIMWININKVIDFKMPNFKRILLHFKENIILFIPQISTSIYSVFDQTMIGWLYKNVDEVGFYSQAHKLVNMLLFLVTTIGTVMLPNIVKKRTEENDEKVKEVTNFTFKIALFLSLPIAIGFSAVSPFFISWFLPQEFEKVAYIICSLSPIIVLISLSNVLGVQYLIVMDESKKFTVSVTLGCFINLVLNMMFIKKIGAYGAAIASVITELCVLLIQYSFVKNSFNFSGILKKIFKYLLVSILMGVIVYFIGYIMGNGIITNFVQVIVGIVIYIGILFLLDDDIEKFLIDKVLDVLKIKR